MTRSRTKLILISTIAFAVTSCGDRQSAESYLNAALEIIEKNALQSASVDWQTTRLEAIDRLGDAPTLASAHESIRFVLAELNDNHSHLLTPGDLADLESVGSGASNLETPRPEAISLADEIAYLRLPSFVGSSEDRMTAFADTAQEELAAIDSDSVCGWILDLRDNPGGNVWPMLAGVGPLLGDGVVSSFVYSADNSIDIWYEDGEVAALRTGVFGRRISVSQAAVSGEPYELKNPDSAVAVMVGPRTASSGEFVAISFVGRPGSTTFGMQTIGQTTNNDSYPLEDGAVLVLATSVMADRTGRKYGGAIEPEFAIGPEPLAIPLQEQTAIASAIEWLRDQETCRG